MKLIKKGAEGDLFESIWNNKRCIIKQRMPKPYRNLKLDSRLRKSRTIREAQIISQVKSFGVSSPLIYFVDMKNYKIYMQFIRGKPVHDLSKSKVIDASYEIGKIVGKMHKNGIMHGDLTTSNFLRTKDRIYVIDFGLAQRTSKKEDFAVDLRLFKEILSSAHTAFMQKAWKKFLSGYKTQINSDDFDTILHLVSVIESRGRYATVV